MKYNWIDGYLLEKKGVTKNLQADWNWIRYCIEDKMFAARGLDNDAAPSSINVKTEQQESIYLREQYEDIIPGYYSNKVHWNSIKPDGAVSDDLMKHLLDESYELILAGFSKKKQREILGEE